MHSLVLASVLIAQPQIAYFENPSGTQYAAVVPGGTTILPNGRFLTPLGKRLYTNTDLWQVVLTPSGDAVFGFADNMLTRYTDLSADKPTRKDLKLDNLAPCGAFNKDGSKFLVSLGDKGTVVLIDAKEMAVLDSISMDVDGEKDSYINDLVFAADGKTAFGVDVANQHLVVIDTEARKLVKRVPAGREPYSITLSSDGKTAFVANIGLFDYSVIPLPEAGKGNPRGLTEPAFNFPSKEAEVGVYKEGRQVPGLGKPGTVDSQSVWAYDLSKPLEPKVVQKKTSGILIHAPADAGKAVGGSAPNEVIWDRGNLFVANANNDTISVFNRNLKLHQNIKLSPVPALARLRGVIPSGMAISPDGQRLYVCESGLNAIAVIERKSGKVLGHFPTGWFPMQIALSPDGRQMYIACQKGIGRGPQGPLDQRVEGDERFGLPAMPGTIQAVTIPSDAELERHTQTVLRNNGLVPKRPPSKANPVSYVPGLPSKEIKYVVFITKENHTFDGIFGADIPGSKAQPAYAEFGLNGWIREKGRAERVPIMPNHIKLAREFSISDNFYMEPQASGDGHRWLVGVYPSLWTTRVFYAGWAFRPTNDAKGRLVSFGSDGSQIPEDYLENGSMFEHLHRNQISFRNYGQGYELPRTDEGTMNHRSGAFYPYNHPMPKVLGENTCFGFPAYNTNIPDIYRADWFIQDLEKNFRQKGKPLPRFLNAALCNDHGDNPKPEFGFPYFSSYLADNDLALGRMVDWLSHQPEWKNMAIFVTQDDPGGHNDHVDRHRSFVMCISPYAKRGYVTKEHTSIMSIIKTIYLTFGLGPNNMFDAVTTGLHDMFTTTPDFTPYKHVSVDPRVFKPAEAIDIDDPDFKKRRGMSRTKMDDPEFMERINRTGG